MFQLLAETLPAYSYTTTTTTTSTSVGAAFWITYFVVLLVSYLVGGFLLSRIFKKAGRSPGAAFIPFYNSWVLFELGGKSGANIFWVFLPFVGPIVFFVFYIMAMIEMGRRFGKSTTFSVLGLVLFSLIGFIILGFDDSKYQGAPTAAPSGPMPPMPGMGAPVAPTMMPGAAPEAPVPPSQPQPPVQPPSVMPPASGTQSGGTPQPPVPPTPGGMVSG